jgi:UDP-N-acetylglucosamine--N-acetylmuramyl-(pentapeptide) pyrophosphoryl-undecaprenol N-acetylglucosamine transferase
MAGGTGGHVFPALAVARCLQAQGVPVHWLGSAAGIENRVVPTAGIALHHIDVEGIRGKGVATFLAAPLIIFKALAQAFRTMRRLRPGVALGMGGFVSGPGGIAAWLLGIPLVIHEQNAIPGLTNRLLAHFAAAALEGFPGSLPGGNRHYTGNPVREDIAGLPPPEQRLRANRDEGLRLLVLGGSQGARALNELIPALPARLEGGSAIRIWHQTGERHYATTRAAYDRCGIDPARVRVTPFIEDMAEAYAWADLAICRAGALTLAELCVAGLPAILVPYPYAVDDHQTLNAGRLVAEGCAILIPERSLDVARLTEAVAEFRRIPEKLIDMARRARGLAMPDAAHQVAGFCLEYRHA